MKNEPMSKGNTEIAVDYGNVLGNPVDYKKFPTLNPSEYR